MDLKGPPILILSYSYFVYIVFMYVTTVTNAQKYSQSDIDDAWAKMAKREVYYKSLENQTGCWPQNIIPIVMDPKFSLGQVQHIFKDFAQILKKTCVRFVADRVMENFKKRVFFVFEPDDHGACYTVERKTSENEIRTEVHLGEDCFPEQSVIHELLHVLGILHEQQRIDRDCYVKVDSGITDDNNHKIVYDDLTFERWPYDKRSITHYVRQTLKIKDRNEGFFDLPWNYRLGDEYGGFLFWGNPLGEMTTMDIAKVNFRFCGAPDYCDVNPFECDEIEADEKKDGCKEIYELIADGTLVPSKLKG